MITEVKASCTGSLNEWMWLKCCVRKVESDFETKNDLNIILLRDDGGYNARFWAEYILKVNGEQNYIFSGLAKGHELKVYHLDRSTVPGSTS